MPHPDIDQTEAQAQVGKMARIPLYLHLQSGSAGPFSLVEERLCHNVAAMSSLPSTHLKDLAARLLRDYPGRWIEPTLRRKLLDEQSASEFATGNSLTEMAPIFSFGALVETLSGRDTSLGTTHFIFGAAGQGKSRLAVEIAAHLLRAGRPCLVARRQELDRIRSQITTADPQDLVARLAEMFDPSRKVFPALALREELPVVLDGWNEMEERYGGSLIYDALLALISGACRFPVVVTSRRQWWETEQDISINRILRHYRLEPFDDDQRDSFVHSQGVEPRAFRDELAAAGLDDVCTRPFFLEQAVLIYRSGGRTRERLPQNRAALMQRALTVRFGRVKSAVHRGAYRERWPKGEHLMVASALAAIAHARGEIDSDAVRKLLRRHFSTDAPFERLVEEFVNTYLLDPLHEKAPDTFVFPHETLRDFGIALAWKDRSPPPFFFLPEKIEHVAGYWVGLQSDRNAAARQILNDPQAAERPGVIADILAANISELDTETREALWRRLGDGLVERRAIRDATVTALRDLPPSLRSESATTLLAAVQRRWPNVIIFARQVITSAFLDTASWQALTRRAQKSVTDERSVDPERQISFDTKPTLLRPAFGSQRIQEGQSHSDPDGQPADIAAIHEELGADGPLPLISLVGDQTVDAKERARAATVLGECGVLAAAPHLRSCLENGEIIVRAAAARSLGLLQDRAAAPVLRKLINDPEPEIRFRVVMALGRIGDKSARAEIEKVLVDPNAHIRGAAATALGLLRDRAAVPSLVTALTDEDDTVRGSAITALGLLGDRTTRRHIERLLSDRDGLNVAAAATALGALGDRAAVAPLITALQAAAPNARASAATALGALGDRAAVAPLITALQDPAPITCASAATALGALGDRAAVAPLITALQDADPNVRGSAATALGALGDRTAVAPLIRALQDPAPIACASAATALGALGDRAAVAPLITALQDAAPNVRGSAATALGALGDRTAVAPLITALQDAAPRVRGSAATALGALGDRMAVAPLITALQDAAPRVRGSAATALGALGDRDVIDTINNVLSSQPDDQKIDAAMRAFERMNLSSDVPDFIYAIAALPDPANKEAWRKRVGDNLAGRAMTAVSRRGVGARAISLLTAIVECDPSAINRTEAIGGLARLGALNPALVSYLIDPMTPGPRPDQQVDRNASVRGRICYFVLLEFAKAGMPDPAKLEMVVRHLADTNVSSQTVRTALAAIDRLDPPDALRAIQALENVAARGAPSSSLMHILPEYRFRVTATQVQEQSFAELKTKADEVFALCVQRAPGIKDEKTMSIENFIVIAARQELTAIRRHLRSRGLADGDIIQLADRRPAQTVRIATASQGEVTVALMLASEKGSGGMRDLLDAIHRHEQPKRIFMVGMMAGIKGKARILDVVVPLFVVDATAVGTKNGRLVPEQRPGTFDVALHDWAQFLDEDALRAKGIRLITHKKTAIVAAKFDDISHELVQSIIDIDRENIVGFEMEGGAMTSKQLAELRGGTVVQHIMTKGVADYAGETLDPAEVDQLRSIGSIAPHLDNPDPTNNSALKEALQEEATARALRVAISILETMPR